VETSAKTSSQVCLAFETLLQSLVEEKVRAVSGVCVYVKVGVGVGVCMYVFQSLREI
jgi:hypothetical protein